MNLEEYVKSYQMEFRENFDSFIDSSLNLIYINDLEGNILDANDFALKTLGYDIKEIRNLSLRDLIDKEHLSTVFTILKEVKETGQKSLPYEFKLKLKNNDFIHVESYWIPFKKDEKFYAFLSIAKDINQYKKIKGILQGNRGENSIILDGITDLVVYYENREMKIAWANKAAFEDRNISLNQIIGKYCYFLWHQRDKPCDDCPIIKSFKTGKPEESEIYSPDGRIWLIKAFPAKDEFEHVIGVVEVTREITEKKRIGQKLKESELKYRTLVENSLQGIIIFQDSRIVFANATIATILECSIEEILNLSAEEAQHFVHPDDLNFVQKIFKDYMDGNSVIDKNEFRIINKENKIKWVDMYFAFFEYEGKSALQIVFTDITDRKNAEDSLIESQKKYEILINNALTGVWVIDSEAKSILVNPYMANMLGYSIDEMIGQSLFKFMSDNWIKIAQLKFDERKKGVKEIHDFEFLHKNGNKVYSRLNTTPLFDNKGIFIGAVAFVENITDYKKAQEKLRESEEKYRGILENISEGYYEVDLKGNFTFFSEKFSEFLGFPKEKLLGMNYREIADKEEAEKVFKIFNKVYKNELKEAYYDYEIIRSDGTKRLIDISVYLKHDPNGNRIGFYGLTRDVTDRRKTERLIKEEVRKLKELDQIRRDFISRASHELKTPLTSIYSATQLLLNLYKDQLGVNALEFVEMINRGGERLKNLVDNLLDISRLELNKLPLKKKKENITEILDDCLKNIAYYANKRSIVLNSSESSNQYYVNVDDFRIKQVIINLLTNAIKNTPRKGEIKIRIKENKDFLDISIKDNGIGLTTNEIKKLFSKFGKIERYGKGLDIETEGSGLGLFLSKEIVERHGGQILVESEGRNKGATFIIRLPKK